MPYTAVRKSGVHAFNLLLRAALLNDETPVAEVASLKRGSQIAHLLNEADAGRLPPRAESEVEYTKYKATDDGRGNPVVIAAGWGAVDLVLRTPDPQLAERVADLLERVDPPKKVRARLGIGWW